MPPTKLMYPSSFFSFPIGKKKAKVFCKDCSYFHDEPTYSRITVPHPTRPDYEITTEVISGSKEVCRHEDNIDHSKDNYYTPSRETFYPPKKLNRNNDCRWYRSSRRRIK